MPLSLFRIIGIVSYNTVITSVVAVFYILIAFYVVAVALQILILKNLSQ